MDIFSKFLYLFGNLIGVTFAIFVYALSNQAENSRYFKKIAPLIFVFYVALYIATDYIVEGGIFVGGVVKFIYGPYKLFFDITLWASFLFALFLQISYLRKKIESPFSETITWYTLVGTYFCLIVGGYTNVIMPILDNTRYIWVGPACTIVWVFSILLGILRSEAFGFRSIITEALGISMVLISIGYSFVTYGTPNFFFALFLVCFSGTYTYLSSVSVKTEIEQKIVDEKLAHDLEIANEKLKSLDKLKSEFVSLASHQLRSPLTVIKGYASTLTDGIVGDLTDKQKEIVRHIYAAAQGLASVVEDFLNVTKIEQGGMKYVFAPTDVKVIFLDLASDMKIAAEDRHLTFTREIDESQSFMVNADGTKIKQVFLNLVDNSIKYTKEGFVTVRIVRDTEKHTMTFSVSDSGVGISQETKEKLFTKFGRGEGAVLNGGGSGLKLYLAHEIVEAHKGRIDIYSEGLGKGSTFSVTLPML
jgi:signal transduction histidine kinase